MADKAKSKKNKGWRTKDYRPGHPCEGLDIMISHYEGPYGMQYEPDDEKAPPYFGQKKAGRSGDKEIQRGG